MIRYNVFAISRRRIFLLLASAMLFALAIWILNDVLPYQNFWYQFEFEPDIGTYFCEKTFMEKIVRQPINTFSNFFYFMAGVAILRRGWKDQSKRQRYNIISANPFYSIAYGIILVYTFAASTLFHSSLIYFTGKLDYSAVYSLALFPLMYFSHRFWLHTIGVPSNVKHTKSTTTVITVFTGLYIWLTFFLPPGWGHTSVLTIIGVLIVSGFIMEMRDPDKTNKRYLLTCIIAILIAVVWFAFDVKKILCNPDSVIQPHSLWHFFASVSAFYFYMYIRSEKNPNFKKEAA